MLFVENFNTTLFLVSTNMDRSMKSIHLHQSPLIAIFLIKGFLKDSDREERTLSCISNIQLLISPLVTLPFPFLFSPSMLPATDFPPFNPPYPFFNRVTSYLTGFSPSPSHLPWSRTVLSPAGWLVSWLGWVCSWKTQTQWTWLTPLSYCGENSQSHQSPQWSPCPGWSVEWPPSSSSPISNRICERNSNFSSCNQDIKTFHFLHKSALH